jgi:prepilin-type N-terminal cleavage/methylation domain-containing protein/prepilin-type processing-associated H-X9-DG protein
MRKKGFTLIELLVVISIIAMLLAILMPALSKVKKIAQRVVCATNLKGLGTAQTVYSQDYDDEYAVQDARGKGITWGWATNGFFKGDKKTWTAGEDTTIAASLYLLVREADVSPKSFVCPSGEETEYDGTVPEGWETDIVELWDFGNEAVAAGSGYPYQHVSFAYHMPYGANGQKSPYAADGSTKGAAFAVMADKSPWQDPRIIEINNTQADDWSEKVQKISPYWTNDNIGKSSWEVKRGNSYSHGRDGQNVVFADGHASFEVTTDVGDANDSIYLRKNSTGDADKDIRLGTPGIMTVPEGHDQDNWQPNGGKDSFLLGDDAQDIDSRP